MFELILLVACVCICFMALGFIHAWREDKKPRGKKKVLKLTIEAQPGTKFEHVRCKECGSLYFKATVDDQAPGPGPGEPAG